MINWQIELSKFDEEQHRADYLWEKKRRRLLVDLDKDSMINRDKLLRRHKVCLPNRYRLSLNQIEFIRKNEGKYLCIYCNHDILKQDHVDRGRLDQWRYKGFPKRCFSCFKKFNHGTTHPVYRHDIIRIECCLYCGRQLHNLRKPRKKFCSRQHQILFWAKLRRKSLKVNTVGE